MKIQKFKEINEASKFKKEPFTSVKVKEGQFFLRKDFKPGYYNYLKIKKIIGKDAIVQFCDYDGRIVGGETLMRLSDIQNRVDELGKEKHEKEQISKELIYNIKKELGNIKGGDLNSLKVINELKKVLTKLKEIGNEFSTKDSSVPAGGFSGANSFTMRSSQSGKAINLSFNSVHRGGYYSFDKPYLVQIQIGGALDLDKKRALIEVSKELLSKFNFESDLGKSHVQETDGTNWLSVMLTAPSKGGQYTIIKSLKI